jgi:hypothetical protein
LADWHSPSDHSAAGAVLALTVATKPLNANRDRFAKALGEAVLERWAQLPQDIQHTIFEQAVVCGHHDERDESLREQLAEYLHDHHPRTEK